MEAMTALIISRTIEQTVFMLCSPLLLYLGYRLVARALDQNGQARIEMREKYRFQAASCLPGSACMLLAVVIAFAGFSHPFELSKIEQDLLIKLDQIDHTVSPPQSAAPVTGGKGGAGPKPS